MCAKQLFIKSNGQWVAAGGAGGSVDTAGLATEQFVTDAIDAGGFATLTDLNDTLANIPEAAITVHDGPIPNPAEETPKGLEDSFDAYADGLHYFKEPGTLVAITRQQYQTDITLTGPVSSAAKIVKSEAGLPTPQNPSLIVLKTADGQWIKMTSGELDKPFGMPQMVDLFGLSADIAALASDGLGKKADLAGNQNQLFSVKNGITSWQAVNRGQLDDVSTLAYNALAAIQNLRPLAENAAPKSTVYTKTESDAAFAKKDDNTQNIVANAVVAKGYAFGDSTSGNNPGLVYTDTNEGYGPRLVLDTPGGKELIPYQSDFEPIKARLNTLESKGAPPVIDAYTKTECDTKFLTLVDLGVVVQKGELPAALAPYALKTDLAPYATTTVVNTAMASFATRAYVDEKYNTVYPMAAVTLNDPGMAAFKQSVLDEVKKMMAGGKTIPADVPWTKLLNAGTAANAPEAKVLNGIVYMRGEAVKQGGAGYSANAYQLPPTIPAPPREMVVPLAMKNTNPSGRYYGYATIQTNRQIGVSCDNSFNTVWFDGISYPAYE